MSETDHGDVHLHRGVKTIRELRRCADENGKDPGGHRIERAAVTGAAHADDRPRDGNDVERRPPRGLVDTENARYRAFLCLPAQSLVVTREVDSLVANESLLARPGLGRSSLDSAPDCGARQRFSGRVEDLVANASERALHESAGGSHVPASAPARHERLRIDCRRPLRSTA